MVRGQHGRCRPDSRGCGPGWTPGTHGERSIPVFDRISPVQICDSLSLKRVDLQQANLADADLTHAFLHEANLCDAELSGATMVGTNLCRASLRNARLAGADLHRANFDRADLAGADLSGANLERTLFVGTIVSKARFSDCKVYGASAWDLDLSDVADQSGLRITRDDQPERITVDNLQVAQLVYLLLHNRNIRDVIETVGKKGVLLIGRLTGRGGTSCVRYGMTSSIGINCCRSCSSSHRCRQRKRPGPSRHSLTSRASSLPISPTRNLSCRN